MTLRFVICGELKKTWLYTKETKEKKNCLISKFYFKKCLMWDIRNKDKELPIISVHVPQVYYCAYKQAQVSNSLTVGPLKLGPSKHDLHLYCFFFFFDQGWIRVTCGPGMNIDQNHRYIGSTSERDAYWRKVHSKYYLNSQSVEIIDSESIML